MTTLMSGGAGIAKRRRRSTRPGFSPSRALAQALALQRERWLLWLPAAMIAGAAFWLVAPRDPPLWLGPAAFVAGASAAFGLLFWPSHTPDDVWLALRRALAGALALAGAAGLGASAAEVRAALAATPMLAPSAGPVLVEGWVVASEPSASGPRLRLLARSIESAREIPRYVRVSVADAGVLTPGRGARCMAVLGPPSGPLAPGGYDFARRAYFDRLGGTGFVYGRCRPAEFAPPASLLDRMSLRLAAWRSDLLSAITEAAPGRGGAIAGALVSGDRSAVDQATSDALQNSGLGHLLSVSGVHMGVVGGVTFALVLWTLSLIAPIALRFPVKKIAAAAALAVLGIYFVASGATVPALRSYVMACVVLGAVLIDRPAISMRGLALATFLVVLVFPDSVLEPGFQMSFAASLALVALFELMKRPPSEPALPAPGPIVAALQLCVRGLGGVMLVSLAAGLATDPFAIYHFQRFSLYALPSNLIAEPIMSFLVAPLAAAAALLAPFGLAEPALRWMASALDLVAAVAQTFGERPEAVRALPRPPDAAFLACVAALLWACLWRGALRWGALGFFAAAAALYLAAPQPLAAFDADLRAVYVRDAGGWSLAAKTTRTSYARERLGAMLGLSPLEVAGLAPPQDCTEDACVWRVRERAYALVRTEAGFASACEQGAVVIAALSPPADFSQRCRPAFVSAPSDRTRFGGAAAYETADGLTVLRARPAGVDRPWARAARRFDQE